MLYNNLGIHTDLTLGKSAIQFKDLKDIKFNTPIAICDNGNISQLVKSLKLNKNNIPAVELFVIKSYAEKRTPIYRARFFAFDLIAYESICKMINIASLNKYYSHRIEIKDLILNGDIIIIVDSDFLFIDQLPYEKTYVAINANTDLSSANILKYKPIFYYDSYAIHKKDISKVELLSARGFKHNNKVWYYDDSHYHTASLIPESITNYLNLLKKADHPIIKFENRYPIYCEGSEDYFDVLVYAGFKRKYPNATQQEIERLDYEVSIIKKLGYQDYFLINWDFINWSRNRNIPIGPGRGSAAGSIVAYCLDITKLDPIANGLYFERFLNPERVSPPDIDTDISDIDRAEVIDYIRQRYGKEKVSQIITFSELKSKSALKDAARLHEMDASEVNRITSYFPPSKFGIPPTLEEAYNVELVRSWADSHASIWNEAKALEGFVRQVGIHAAGLIIAPKEINTLTGIQYANGEAICQFDKDDAEKFGLLKMDFLGLATLGLIKKTQELLGKSYYDMEKVPLDDWKVYDAFSRGDTHGVFQFESDGMRKLLKRIKPTSFADIAAATALYRPGPLMSGLTENYIHNKHSINPEYLIPEFQELLSETYGIFAYQEQVMLVSQKIAGFTLSRADNLRKAIGKKDRNLMKTMEEEFISGCLAGGQTSEKAEKLWTQIVSFADYCFNKSHSYAYALISYWTMYLKLNYPKEFAVSLLSLDMKDSSALRSHFFAFKDKINFIPPYINKGGEGFKICDNGIMMGFGSIKGMGNSSSSIENNQPYKNISDVVIKNNLDKTQLTTLIYSGAFDEMEPDKSVLLGNLERLLKFGKENKTSEIFNIFDPSEVFNLDRSRKIKLPIEGYMEKACYGFNIYHGFVGKNKWLIDSLESDSIIGTIIEIKRAKTKVKQQDMAILTIETAKGNMKAVLFPNIYDKFSVQLAKEETYAFRGELKYGKNNEGDEEASLIVSDMLIESGIVINEVKLEKEEAITQGEFNNILDRCYVGNGYTTVKVFEIQNDGDSHFLFKHEQSIDYTESIHKILLDNRFDILIKIF
jgi:DNA polymerase-3 subunit alpha